MQKSVPNLPQFNQQDLLIPQKFHKKVITLYTIKSSQKTLK